MWKKVESKEAEYNPGEVDSPNLKLSTISVKGLRSKDFCLYSCHFKDMNICFQKSSEVCHPHLKNQVNSVSVNCAANIFAA